jgi:two-component system chemotaxis response regulator CheB
MSMARVIKVMIVDDSALVRQVMSRILGQDSGIEVIAAVHDPIFAITALQKQWPDVIVLDIEMPRMDGLTFLRKIMAERPTPVIICSSLAEKGASATFDALAAGAVSIVTKPKVALRSFLEDSANDLVQAVRAAAQANLRAMPNPSLPRQAKSPSPASRPAAAAFQPTAPLTAMNKTTEQLVAIGTSTGGTQALEYILTRLPTTSLGIVIVQHMPEKFTAMFAERLDSLCEIEVREARDGDRVLPGCALIAPGGRHMSILRSGAQYRVEVADGPVVNRHKPSVDVLFRSVARYAGANALGIIMTGMGDDGARGLKEMHIAGANTIAQDEASCVVFGMPMEAIKLGAADRVLPLDRIAEAIITYSRNSLLAR